MRISFDFDGTLEDEFGGFPVNNQKDEIQSLAAKYVKAGHKVIILTKRYGPENSNKGLGNEHLAVSHMATKLGIKEMVFTNREMKFSYIRQLGIDMHFENDEYEVSLIRQACDKCLVIPVEENNWRDLLN